MTCCTDYYHSRRVNVLKRSRDIGCEMKDEDEHEDEESEDSSSSSPSVPGDIQYIQYMLPSVYKKYSLILCIECLTMYM